MNPELEIAGFDEHAIAGWMTLELRTSAATLRTFANVAAPPQFLLGVQGDAPQALIERLLACLARVDVSRETASTFVVPAAIAPFDTLGFIRGPERRLLRGILEDDAVLQVVPMYACELTAEGRLPPLANFRRCTDLLALDRPPQPWFHFRMHGRPSGLEVQQWATEAWPTFVDYLGILSQDDQAWLEVRNRKSRILRLSSEDGWEHALERVRAHVGSDPVAGPAAAHAMSRLQTPDAG